MRFVVTGAGGFLGSHLLHHLLTKTTHDVVAVSSQEPERVIARASAVDAGSMEIGARLRIEHNDTLLRSGLLRDRDVVINCAFPWNRGGQEMATGLTFQRDLFRCARDSRVETFINISSQSVYDDNRTYRASETSPLDLSSPYAVAKYSMELLSSEIFDRGQLVNARMGSLIGRGYDVRIVNRLLIAGIAGETLVVEDGSREFSFMDAREASLALVTIGEQGVYSGANVINVGTEDVVSLREIANEVSGSLAERLGHPVSIELREPVNAASFPPRYSLDCGLLRETYGFASTHELPEVVRWIAQGLT